jgi:type II secretory pathway component PulC
MSDGERRLRVIAISFATVAMVVAIAAALVVMRRGDHAPAHAPNEPEKPALAPLLTKTVLAADVIKLQRKAIDPVVENGQTLGVKIKDPDLAHLLGLEPEDIIVSLSGRPLSRETDVYDAIFNVSMMSGTTMYVEITRDGVPTLVRWKLDGDLRQARYANSGNTLGGLYGSGAYTPPPPPPPDPMLDTIEKVDDTHVKMPRKTAEYIFSNPVSMTKGARVVPAIKNGKAAGFKVYAIRPSSVFAKIGL